MEATELKEIKEYWGKKYPQVVISLQKSQYDGRYRANMMTNNDSIDFQAETVDELISQGESFLRRLKQE
jgi:hypothetical protein